MAGMNVPLEPEEIKRLVELVYLGEWVINAHHDPDYQDDDASAVVQKIMAASKVKGVDKDIETGQFYLDTNWAERLYDQYIVDYDDHVFWDELIERLAQRDLAQQRGVPMDEISRDEDIRSLRPLEEKYRHELEENGIDRLELGGGF
jgi:hypothetical protein